MKRTLRARGTAVLISPAAVLVVLGLALAPIAPWQGFTGYVAMASELPDVVQWNALDPASIVKFRSGATPTDEWGVPHDTVQGYLRKPDGPGPFPAVVLVHNFVIGTFHKAWVDRLVDWGYVALLVNSNTRGDATTENRAHDAYGALVYLRQLPYVDGNRVALIGWGTKGGAAVLLALQAEAGQAARPLAIMSTDAGTRFRVGIAYYPYCPARPFAEYAPALLLLGELDAHSAPAACVKFAEDSRQNGGAKLQVKEYANTTHLFDAGKDGKDIVGKPYRFDRAATTDAVEQVKATLAASLR